MAPSMASYCDLTQLTLEADDIAGIESVYPPTSGGGSTLVQPSQLSVSPASGAPTSSLVLNWADNSSSETGFRIERSAGGAFSPVAQVGGNLTSWTDTGLAANTAYDYRVAAYNSTTTSPYSNIGSGRTASSTTANTAPTVAMNNPLNNASYPEGATVSFSGSQRPTARMATSRPACAGRPA